MELDKTRMLIFLASMIGAFIVLRVSLHMSPNSNFDVAGYNIHHLFSGLVLVVLGGVPLAVLRLRRKTAYLATFVFGVGLGMALDEWVYLITTDGSDASYLLPISFWGGVAAITLASVYALLFALINGGRGNE